MPNVILDGLESFFEDFLVMFSFLMARTMPFRMRGSGGEGSRLSELSRLRSKMIPIDPTCPASSIVSDRDTMTSDSIASAPDDDSPMLLLSSTHSRILYVRFVGMLRRIQILSRL